MNHTLNAIPYTLTIGWLYPELMSTYGDRGNIICLQKRCEWRGIQTQVKRLDLGFKMYDLRKCDFLFMGGAQDRQQKIVANDLNKEKVKALKELIDIGTPGLFICGAYQFLGKYYKEADGTIIKGLGILDLYTESPGENSRRLIGNISVRLNLSISHIVVSVPIPYRNHIGDVVGFENHGGRTYLGKNIGALGTVLKGFGNNGKDKTEGAVYKNSFGSYLHGPILPKNPHFADLLIKLALKNKYKRTIKLSALEDSLEWQAHNQILKN